MKLLKVTLLSTLIALTGCKKSLNGASFTRIKLEVYAQEFCKDNGGVHLIYYDTGSDYALNCLDGKPFNVTYSDIRGYSHPRIAEVMREGVK